MSEIHVRRVHGMTHKKARDAAEKVAKRLQDEFDLEWRWDEDDLRFERAGVNGHLHVGPKEISLTAKLGFMLGLVKPRIEAEIHKTLDDVFRSHKPARTAGKAKR
jgi:putative polyhydroxyalkanoate system protein